MNGYASNFAARRRLLLLSSRTDELTELRKRLRDEGFVVSMRGLGEVDPTRAVREYGLLVVDLRSDWEFGLQFCTQVRELDQTAYQIVLAPSDDEIDVVIALEAGADDVVTDVSRVEAVVARVRVGRRRHEAEQMQRPAREDRDERVLRFLSITIDPWAREAIRGDRRISLTEREFDLLYYMGRHPGKAISRTELLERVWDSSLGVYSRTVDTHVRRLREKLEDDPSDPEIIGTVWGVGYRFIASPVERSNEG